MTTPSAPTTVPLASQVGGHPGVLTTADGSLLIKPALAAEVGFYEHVGAEEKCAALRPFLPRFYGTLRLEGKVDESAEDAGLRSIVLENLSQTFLKPNIIDIKLGTVLYDSSASEEKRARMEKTARETTSFETGVRLTGFQVYDLEKGIAINTPKSYGKSIKASDLPTGIARFFPLAPSSSSTPAPAFPTHNPEIVTDTGVVTNPDPEVKIGTGLPIDILLPVLKALREDVQEIRDALAETEMRMVGGSLLIIYEADWDRAREGLKVLRELKAKARSNLDEEEEDEEEDEESDDEGEKETVGAPYIAKLIDFAHTRIAPGEGPDEGVLKGVDTTLALLDGRIEEVKRAVASK